MNRFTMLAALAATSAVIGTAAVLAQANEDFSRADANNDGIITYAEAHGPYNTLTPQLFAMADTNHDGHLDETEWPLLGSLMPGSGNQHSTEPSAPPPEPSSSEPSAPV